MALERRKKQITFMVQLARSEGVLSHDEILFISKVSEGYGISKEELDDIFNNTYKSEVDFHDISKEECIEFMYDIICLAKIDNRVYQEEIASCLFIARHLALDVTSFYYLITYGEEQEVTGDAKQDNLAFIKKKIADTTKKASSKKAVKEL